ncbi:unnamed protein product [Closterium sp. NIES-65]|nr:unnamed protein product [Closterium sp. NIES-65]
MARSIAVALVLLAAFAAVANAATGAFTYEKSGIDWTGACATGERQSPVNIVMDKTVQSKKRSSSRSSDYRTGGDPPAATSHRADYKLRYFVHVNTVDPKKARPSLCVHAASCTAHDDDSAWVNQWLPQAPLENNANATISITPNFWSEMIDASSGFWALSRLAHHARVRRDCFVARAAQGAAALRGADDQFMNIMAVSNQDRTEQPHAPALNGRTIYFHYPAARQVNKWLDFFVPW